MKKLIAFLAAALLIAWAVPAVAQLIDAKPCRFLYINKTVKARIGVRDDISCQVNTINALWPVELNGKECTSLQNALRLWISDKDNIYQIDKAVEEFLYTDNESVPFGEIGPYTIVDEFSEDDLMPNRSIVTIELKKMGTRFVSFSLFYNMYFSGAAHGMYAQSYVTYDTQLDKVVTLEDILVDPELIRPYIKESIELADDYNIEDIFLPDGELPNVPRTFYCENGFLHLVYNPYEIAGFAQGVIDVPIIYPYDETAPEYLTPYGKTVMEKSSDEEVW